MGLAKRDKIFTERVDDQSNLFNIKFLFTEKRTTPNSPLLIWVSDKKDFGLYNPNLLPLLKRDFVICFISIKDRENLNIKALIEEFQQISINLVAT